MQPSLSPCPAPLGPGTLMAANVPLEDALWLCRRGPSFQMQALRSQRGMQILASVRNQLQAELAASRWPATTQY